MIHAFCVISMKSLPILRSQRFLVCFFFLAALRVRCCVQAFSSCGKQGLLFVAVRGLLIEVASLIAEHGL